MSGPRILLLGAQGQVGRELQRSLSVLGQVVALDRRGQTMPDGRHLCGDLLDLQGLQDTVRWLQPVAVVNAAAHTAVDRAEDEPDLAARLNTQAPAALAQVAAETGAWLVHYSTDYVFDGSGSRPWTEHDPTHALNVYGHSKREGELEILRRHPQHLLFRTSWVYGRQGGNFARSMLRLAQEREHLSVVADQWGAPTGADLIADVTAHALHQVLTGRGAAGLYHLVAAGETSWHGYADWLIGQARQRYPERHFTVQSVDPVPSSAFVTRARRPFNSRLDTRALQQTFGLVLPHWQQGLARWLGDGW